MKCKAFDVEIEMEIQAVSCPGVWLCPHGKLTMQVYLLGVCSQTSTIKPVFPLHFGETFSFHKTFSNAQNLFELHKKLGTEVVYIELIQWENCDSGNVLATFRTSLLELLCPGRKGVINGIDVDLLMEATKRFPGIIAPKIEVSTKITIKEVLYAVKGDKKNELIIVNPKIITSKCIPKRNAPLRQRKVCHTYKYHQSKSQKRSDMPMITNCDQECSSPRPQSPLPKQCGYQNKCLNLDSMQKKLHMRQVPRERCACCSVGLETLCPLCKKYKCYFTKSDKPASSGMLSSGSGHNFAQRNKCGCRSPGNKGSSTPSGKYNESCGNSTRKKMCPSNSDNRTKCGKPTRKITCSSDSDVSENGKKTSFNEKKQNEVTENSFCFSKSKCHLFEELDEKLKNCKSISSCCTCLSEKENVSAETCSEQFYKSLESYYRQLYIQAHYKRKCRCFK